MADDEECKPAAAGPGGGIGVFNIGEPLRFKDVQAPLGFAAEPSKPGQLFKVQTRLALTSDEPDFHRLVEVVDGVVRGMAQESGTSVDLRRAGTALLIFKPDNCAELWVDTAAVLLQITAKRAVAAGSVAFDRDIADVRKMEFPCVNIGETDKVLCLFREGWGFGLAFDFNPGGKIDLGWFSTELGSLFRRLRYRHLYKAVTNPEVFDPLVAAGWFPFVEILTTEYLDLVRQVENGFNITEMEAKIVAAFDAARLGHLVERWAAKPHLATKAALLEEAVDAFTANRPASVIKIVLTEIEGVLNGAYKACHGGRGARLKELLAFAQAAAEQRAGGPNTLFFSAAFGRYLSAHTFANFDSIVQTGTASSRHAVGHGAAAQDSYTMTRALQAVLTLDQLAFYT